MVHPYGPYWIPITITLLVGAPFGLLGALGIRALLGRTSSIAGSHVAIAMVMGGGWWSASANLPPWGFPAPLLRSLLGAVIVGAVFEVLFGD
jgi:hypothetical protein